MFALEIDFHDGISPPETILVRRSNAVIGSSDVAHVVIEGAASSLCELRLVRGLGREFSCYPVRRPGQSSTPPPFLEGTYSEETELKLGELTFYVTALDLDVMLGPEEAPDKGALRVLRAALERPSPLFPAVAVLGPKPMFVSFLDDEPLLIGRSRRCGLRLDSSDVSSEHARIGVEDEMIWVEDLGSTNGTFVNEERISGRRFLVPGERVGIGAEFTLAAVLSGEEVTALSAEAANYVETSESSKYPCVVGYGAEIRPARKVLREGELISIGRDPASDMWVNAAHISRQHVVIRCGEDYVPTVTDTSSNGTFHHGERLERDESVEYPKQLTSLDLSEGIFLGLCFNESDERAFLSGERGSIEDSLPELPPVRPTEVMDDSAIKGAVKPSETGSQSEASGGVFQRFAQRQSNQAHIEPEGASQYSDSMRPAPTDSQVGISAFEADLLQDGSGARPVDTQYDESLGEQGLLASEELDDELLRTPYFRGINRWLIVLLVLVPVSIILLLFIGIFSDRQF